MEHTPQPIEHPTVWTYEQLKERMKLGYMQERTGLSSFAELPKVLDIGHAPNSFGGRTLECARQTAVDPKHYERGGVIMFDPLTQKIHVTAADRFQVGDEGSVMIMFKPKTTHERDQQAMQMVRDRIREKHSPTTSEEYYALLGAHLDHFSFTRRLGMIHSHPTVDTFSITDMSSFLMSNDMSISALGTQDGKLHVLIASDETKRIPSGKADVDAFCAVHEASMYTNMQMAGKREMRRLGINADMVFRQGVERGHRAYIAHLAEEFHFGYYIGDATGVLKRLRVRQ